MSEQNQSTLNRIQEVGALQDYKNKLPKELVIVNLGCSWNKDDAFNFIINNQNDIKEVNLIDAAPESIEKCKELYEKHVSPAFYKKIKLHQIAIVTNPNIDTVDFIFPHNDTSSGFASTNPEMVLNHYISEIVNGPEEIKTMQKSIAEGKPIPYTQIALPCTTINNFLMDCNLRTIDRLYIDLEGLDGHVLLDLDLNHFNVPFIMYEHLHLDSYRNMREKGSVSEPLHEKLKKYNFNIYAYGPWNAIALNERMDLSIL